MIIDIRKVFHIVVMTLICSIAPALAQTSGVGDDERTSLMWKGFDSSIALWRLDPNLTSVVASQNYGPYIGYTPIALTTDLFSDSHVLWNYTDGSISLWTLDPSMNFIAGEVFGPYPGWNAIGLSADPFSGSFRLIWKNTDGAASIWLIDDNGDLASSVVLGPFAGYDPASRRRIAVMAHMKRHESPSERYYRRGKPSHEAAAAAMDAHRQAIRTTGARKE